jgi:16S rRNA (guanine527-N7)-methyltransferase
VAAERALGRVRATCFSPTGCENVLVLTTTASAPATDELVLPIDSSQRAQLAAYLELLLRSAQVFNLTAIQQPAEAWNRHVLESLRLLALLGPGRRLIDIGSGGGVPGLVLAIARPDVSVTLLEATGKKARFLEQTAAALGLTNVGVIAERAEVAGAAGTPHRATFDIVTARAVAPLRVLIELTAPFARVDGLILAVKGENAPAELEAAANAFWTLHVEHEATVRHPTASVVLLRKRAPTPAKYPRRTGEPKRNPL